MKIIYMGTPDFAVKALEKLNEKHEVCAVVTQPDKPKGRGYEMIPTPVKAAAVNMGIPVYQPEKIKNGELQALLDEIKPDVIVVCAYGKILPEYILTFPKFGCINIHASLLPKYRGAAPIQRAVMDGETESGVTVMQMEKGLDTGDMLLKKAVKITEETTGGALHDELSVLGANAIIEALDLIENGKAVYEKQDDLLSSYAAMINKDTCRIDFSKGKEKAFNQIRGLSPFPTAFFVFESKIIKVLETKKRDEIIPVGVIPNGKSFVIGTGDGSLELVRVKPEGKKEMDGSSFMAGRRQEGGKVDDVLV